MGAAPQHRTTPATDVAGVVWDLGNVLVEWEPFRAVAAGVGDDEARRFLAGFDFGAWNHACDAGRPWDQALAELQRDHPEWAAHGRAYYDNFAASLTGEVPGTVDLLRALHAQGVPQCGLTNWSDELYHAHAPRRFPFLALLDDVVVSGTEGVAKPDRRSYAIVAERMGLPLSRLVFVDDKAANVDAAVALGMTGVVFTGADSLRVALRGLGLPV
ncbi:HAD family hydrolase [Nocardioides sp. SYSU DS0651]|uniref:HAD family hydrolase n=1 Tax=Nocardioides sp. SYSU DS0651 TaxID=3415955 RepID=UPI003F4C8679